MKKLLFLILLISTVICGCAQVRADSGLLKIKDLIDISVSKAEGSGAVRTLTIRYTESGREESAVLDNVKRIDLNEYDDNDVRAQTFAVSDYDGDGVFDIIVYQEFWFPDIITAHAGIQEWPTVYEYDTDEGFIVSSAKHKDYFEKYMKDLNKELAEGDKYMEDDERLEFKRLIFAAEKVADGSFVPQSPYNGQYYEDVYELTKDIR